MKDLSELTDEELLLEAKKLQTNKIVTAVFIGFLMGIILYSVIKNSWGFLTIIPLYFLYKLFSKPAQNAELENILKQRKLK